MQQFTVNQNVWHLWFNITICKVPRNEFLEERFTLLWMGVSLGVLINVIHLCSGEQPHCAYAGCYQFGIQHSLLIMMDKLENLIAIILHHRFPTYHKPLKYDVVERPTIKTSYCKWTVLFYFKWHHYSIAFSFLFCIWSILVDGYMPHHYQQKQQNLYSTQTCSCVTKV